LINISNIEDFKLLQEFTKDRGFTSATIKVNNNLCSLQFEPEEIFNIDLSQFSFTEKNIIHSWLKPFRNPPPIVKQSNIAPQTAQDALIYGKDPTKNIVSIEAKDSTLELFIEENGKITSEIRQNRYWLLAARAYDKEFTPLNGNLTYKYIKYYNTKEAFYADRNKYRAGDTYSIANEKEAAMVLQGLTYFKGMKVDDVSRLHFDLETIGLIEAPHHKILLISTTFIKQGNTTKKLFAIDDYNDDEGDMLTAFCDYVRECNPSVISGFNIFGFDLPYLQICADNNNIQLHLGRNGSPLRIDKYTSKFRKDGSQDYDYRRCYIYGREIVDMMFVAYHFDFARKYERYALKSIIKQEGLEKAGRQFYEANQIAKNWHNLEERTKIKEYCIDDSDDSESLYKLMIAAYFYLTPHIPKTFQMINYSATGSQINSFLVRAYLQQGHSIPRASEAVKFPGAISDGYPGIYKNVLKLDIASLYPSVMLQYEVCDKAKDPKGYFLQMVQYFTKERLENKKRAKDTGDRYFEELEQAQKIVINSSYGLLGAMGLNFNSPKNAALVTEHGREILKKSIVWCTGKEYVPTKVEEVDV
jgi:DNA polymerase I